MCSPPFRKKTMANTTTVRVFTPFNTYLRILKAYNSENFQRSDPRNCLRNVCYAIGVTVLIALIPIVIALVVWYIFDNGASMNAVVVGTPIILTLLQFVVIFIGLIAENRIISQTIHRIQVTIDQRMYFSRETFFSIYILKYLLSISRKSFTFAIVGYHRL